MVMKKRNPNEFGHNGVLEIAAADSQTGHEDSRKLKTTDKAWSLWTLHWVLYWAPTTQWTKSHFYA